MMTGCPDCGTVFRVTENQLAQARGRVRCGACLHVFRAADNLCGDDQGLGGGTGDALREDGVWEGAGGVDASVDFAAAENWNETNDAIAKREAAGAAFVSPTPEETDGPMEQGQPPQRSAGLWVRWGLVVAVLVLVLQVIWFFERT